MDSSEEESQHPVIRVNKITHRVANISGWSTCIALRSESEGLVGNYKDQLYAFRLKNGAKEIESRLIKTDEGDRKLLKSHFLPF